jgi:1-acyl-sn-glycerol-3-phosphate acyltransferase
VTGASGRCIETPCAKPGIPALHQRLHLAARHVGVIPPGCGKAGFDGARGVEDTHELEARARRGESLLFFPEGTFRRMPGLRDFRMGAFIAAAQAGVPVVPVAIHGTRSMLRAGSRRGRCW